MIFKIPIVPQFFLTETRTHDSIKVSLFLAKETKAQVFATDLWIGATENYKQFQEWGIADCVIPIHADANDLPYASEFFDVVISIDSFHYFANQADFLETKILPLVKRGGKIIIAMPGLKKEIHGGKENCFLCHRCFLVVNQISIYGFNASGTNIIHFPYPLHWIFSLELLGNPFLVSVLFYQPKKHGLCLFSPEFGKMPGYELLANGTVAFTTNNKFGFCKVPGKSVFCRNNSCRLLHLSLKCGAMQ